jgi:DNA-binding transcriptional LysR family regulator
MRDRIMDLRHFHYALASAEHGSFRRAAAALNVQQSTVSRGVRSLEHLVGAELFERGHAGIRPTFAGDWFLRGQPSASITWNAPCSASGRYGVVSTATSGSESAYH